MPILKDLEQEEKYEMRRKNLDREFKWTQGQIEKLRTLNSGLLKKQEELISQMKKVSDLLTRLESEGFDFLHGFKVIGVIEFWKAELDEEDFGKSKFSASEDLEKWRYISEEANSRYWSLIFDSNTGDFMTFSKILLSDAIDTPYNFNLPEENKVKLCSFLIYFYEYISKASFSDLLECSTDDFFPWVIVEINCDTVELKDFKIQQIYDHRLFDESPFPSVLEDRKNALDSKFEWSEENIKKILAINAIVWKKFNQAEENLKRLASVFRELSKTDSFFEPYGIEAEIRYQGKKPTDIASIEMQKLLCQYTPDFGTYLGINENIPEVEMGNVNKNEDLNWNFEVYADHFNEDQKKIRFNYFMHRVFIDGPTFSLEDLVRMEEEGFYTRYEINF